VTYPRTVETTTYLSRTEFVQTANLKITTHPDRTEYYIADVFSPFKCYEIPYFLWTDILDGRSYTAVQIYEWTAPWLPKQADGSETWLPIAGGGPFPIYRQLRHPGYQFNPKDYNVIQVSGTGWYQLVITEGAQGIFDAW